MSKDLDSESYDKASAESIFDHALKLTGKSLSEAAVLPVDIVNLKDRGKLGTLVERYYFKHKPPNDHHPDFKDAGVELKVTGVTKAKDGKYVGKERLVLTMINYESIVSESWESNAFLHKCKKMLIMFYLYSKEVPVIERKFVLKPLMYEIPPADLHVIRDDWEKIRDKVSAGKAHELSEGDTFYLGACRKGAGGEKEKPRKQPFSTIKAPARAFSLKQGYLNQLISASQSGVSLVAGKNVTIEEATQLRFKPFIGRTTDEISETLKHIKRGSNHKNFHRELAVKILSGGGSSVQELNKAGIEMKTVRLQANGKPKESMSFPAFDFIGIQSEEWEDSAFFEKLEKKFLIIAFQLDSAGTERLVKAGYWNMPYQDREEAEKVWLDTQKRVGIDAFDLPGMTESQVAHVRPKAKDGNDKALTPQGSYRTKQCFWLNAKYIADVVAGI
jgi:DNA mismatch repair protein MutH